MSASSPGKPSAKLTDWVQAGATVGALVMASWAVLVARDTLRDQQEINRSQLEINRLEQERYQRRYASRVAWWTDPAQPGTVQIQNRSPVPITLLYVVSELPPAAVDEERYIGRIADLPPCSIVVDRIRYAATNKVVDRFSGGRLGLMRQALEFHDPVTHWALTDRGLTRDSVKRDVGEVEVTSERLNVKPVGDCGEGD